MKDLGEDGRDEGEPAKLLSDEEAGENQKMCDRIDATCSCKRLCTAVFCHCGCFLAKSNKRVTRAIMGCHSKMFKFWVTTDDLLQAKM